MAKLAMCKVKYETCVFGESVIGVTETSTTAKLQHLRRNSDRKVIKNSNGKQTGPKRTEIKERENRKRWKTAARVLKINPLLSPCLLMYFKCTF